jgi:hypothetical protein
MNNKRKMKKNVVGDTAMPPDNWAGLARACLSPCDYLPWKTCFIELCQEQANHNLTHEVHITADMLMGRGPFECVDNQLQYPHQAYQQIAITGTRTWQELPTKGEKTLELTSILQGSDEPYQEFVAHLLQNINRILADAKA